MLLNALFICYLVKNYIECNKSSVNLCMWIILRNKKAESKLFINFSSSRVKFIYLFFLLQIWELAPSLAKICSCTKFAEGY